MFDKNIFARRLLELRKAQNLSQSKMGEIAGLTQTAIAKIEKGERAASVEVLYAFSDYFGVTIDYLVGKSRFPDYSASEDQVPFPMLPIRIRELREKRGTDIFVMAEMIEETPRNYAGYEQGEVLPRLRTICAIADYFDVSLDYLIGRSGDPELH